MHEVHPCRVVPACVACYVIELAGGAQDMVILVMHGWLMMRLLSQSPSATPWARGLGARERRVEGHLQTITGAAPPGSRFSDRCGETAVVGLRRLLTEDTVRLS